MPAATPPAPIGGLPNLECSPAANMSSRVCRAFFSALSARQSATVLPPWSEARSMPMTEMAKRAAWWMSAPTKTPTSRATPK